MEESAITRIMPNSLEAEQSVVGSMIMDKQAIVTASEMLVPEDFYHKQYGVIFKTMVDMNNSGKIVDIVTLQDALKEQNVPAEVYSLEFIRDLLAAVPTSANIRQYANIVKDKAILRNIIRVNEGIANECYAASQSTEDILADTEKKIFELVKINCEANYGITIHDVSILRISYPETNLQSIFANISAERQGVIDAILADANAKASNITSSADAEAAKIIAEGENKAAEIRANTEKDVASIYAKAQEANVELFKFLKELDTIVNSVNSNSVLVVDSNAYPFNILLEYSKTVDESTNVVEELEYVLANLPEKERADLVKAIEDLIVASSTTTEPTPDPAPTPDPTPDSGSEGT